MQNRRRWGRALRIPLTENTRGYYASLGCGQFDEDAETGEMGGGDDYDVLAGTKRRSASSTVMDAFPTSIERIR